jgi:hypothetical protein
MLMEQTATGEQTADAASSTRRGATWLGMAARV